MGRSNAHSEQLGWLAKGENALKCLGTLLTPYRIQSFGMRMETASYISMQSANHVAGPQFASHSEC
jgi:hypothetical protein